MLGHSSKMADDEVEDNHDQEITNALIVTNLEPDFFIDNSRKDEFEFAFKSYDKDATFNYLKSFRRARVNFSSAEATVTARLKYHESELGSQIIKCYFAQVPRRNSGGLLPPKPEKLFLISPPSSPPVGWEQIPESEPVINFELIQALARLSPGEGTHTVHPQSEHHPGIVVHLCEDPEGFADRPTILQTRRPAERI